jgi:AcrR family transcriptional regulator
MTSPTRERLIQRALELFHEHGFREVGLDRIIADVGVTKTTFYNHFESKDDLIVHVLKERDKAETAEWFATVRRIGGNDPRAQLLAFFDLLEEWFCRSDFRGCLFIKASAEFPSPYDPIHQTAAEHGAHLLMELRRLAQLAGAAAPDQLAKQLLLLIAGAIVARHADGDQDAATTARQTAEMLVQHHLPLAAIAPLHA